MRLIAWSSCSAVILATAVFCAPAALAQPTRPPCAGVEYILPNGSIACRPADQVVTVQQAPAQPRRSIFDRIFGRNAAPTPAPVVVVPPPSPAPASPAPEPGGGNTAGTEPFVGPLGPIVSPGTGSTGSGPSGITVLPGGSGACSPGAQIAVLGATYTCPPAGVIPSSVLYPAVAGQPPSAGRALVVSNLPVTH